MSHTSLAHDGNVLGAVALAVDDAMRVAMEAVAPGGASVPAALVALETFLGGQTIDALRRVLGLSHSGAVRLVDRLAAAGLVERRRPAVADGRSVPVALTPAGSAVAHSILAARAEALEAALAPLDAGERAALERLHAKLLAGLTDGRAAARRICRQCDVDACGHHDGRCPVTLAADDRDRAASSTHGHAATTK